MKVPCTIMRGGTSKGLFFLLSDLPSDPASRTSAPPTTENTPEATPPAAGVDLATFQAQHDSKRLAPIS